MAGPLSGIAGSQVFSSSIGQAQNNGQTQNSTSAQQEEQLTQNQRGLEEARDNGATNVLNSQNAPTTGIAESENNPGNIINQQLEELALNTAENSNPADQGQTVERGSLVDTFA